MILLDTNALLLLILRPEGLSKAAARVIAQSEAGDGIAIASITLWEIALLIDAGRIAVQGSTEAFLNLILQRPRFFMLELSPEIAALAFQFPADFPNDPADRILAATARAHSLPLVTKDQRLRDSDLVQTI